MAQFLGKVLIIGYGSVSRCTLPLVLKHLQPEAKKITLIDFADLPQSVVKTATDRGVAFARDHVTPSGLAQTLSKYVGQGDMIIDLGWNIGCNDILQWCRDHEVLYINTSIEVWDPYQAMDTAPPTQRTLYHRHMALRRMLAGWGPQPSTTAILDHGANPGLVSHFTKSALVTMAEKWLADRPQASDRRDRLQQALTSRQWNHLAMELGVKTIHVSERDTQITNQPRRVDEFVNTWSIEGFYEEGTSPAEMGWGTHEKNLPPLAHVHLNGPGNQICLASYGCRTWVRSWVPNQEILGMVIRHGEAFSISEFLTVTDNGRPADQGGHPLYRPTVHYAYCPCDMAIASLHELQMRGDELQPNLRIMSDEIIDGADILGCLLMGHDDRSWWIGSMLDIHEARKLAPGQNATTLQVACSVVAAAKWMIEHPRQGVLLPDALPYEYVLDFARPYLGPLFNRAVDWSPLDHWPTAFTGYSSRPKPPAEDAWQFNTFLVRNA